MKKIIRVSLLILLIAWMLLIFCLSAETATESSDTSGGFCYRIAMLIIRDFREMTEAEQQVIIEQITFPVRKLAHFTQFFILAVLSYFNVNYFKISPYLKGITAFLFGSVYAATDEIHQIFVSGRSCQFTDWIIDSIGVLVGILFSYIAVTVFNSQKSRRGSTHAEKRINKSK